MEGASKNARYTSVRVQNKLIVLSEEVVRDNIVKAVNKSNGFFIITDETADIPGTEQLYDLLRCRNNGMTQPPYVRNSLDSFHWRVWTLEQLQILSSTKQYNLVLKSTSSTAKATMDVQPWQKKTMVYRPCHEHPS